MHGYANEYLYNTKSMYACRCCFCFHTNVRGMKLLCHTHIYPAHQECRTRVTQTHALFYFFINAGKKGLCALQCLPVSLQHSGPSAFEVNLRILKCYATEHSLTHRTLWEGAPTLFRNGTDVWCQKQQAVCYSVDKTLLMRQELWLTWQPQLVLLLINVRIFWVAPLHVDLHPRCSYSPLN